MSIKVMTRVWEESPSKGSDLLLLLAIADFADDTGVAWPKTETLAQKIRMSERQVQRIIRNLVDSGQIIVHKNAGPRGANKYQICHPRQDVTPDIAMSPHPRHSYVTPTPDIAVSPEPSGEPSGEPSETAPAQKGSRRRDLSPDEQIVEVWAQECNGGRWPVNPGKDRQQARQLVRAGFDADEARALIQWLQRQTWRRNGITLGLMVNQADNFRAAMLEQHQRSAEGDPPKRWRLSASGVMVEVPS